MAKGESIRVLIADDQRDVSNMFRLLLENAGIEVVAVVATGRGAVEETLRLRPDVILLDIAMPDLDGFAALTIIRNRHPEAIVFMLSSHAEPAYMARAAELGASGFFSKQVDPDHLIRSIRAAAAGEPPPMPDRAEKGNSSEGTAPEFRYREHADANGVDLTQQEEQILQLMVMGRGNDSIARMLTVSQDTVKTHIRSIYRKIGVSNRTEAVLWALRQGYGGVQTLN